MFLNKYVKVLIINLILIFAGIIHLNAQDKKIVQFSGVIIGSDSTSGLPGVHIYVPKAGRGTTSNSNGYFSMPALVGDSIIVSAVGYQKKNFIIPDIKKQNFTVIIEMEEDTTYLPEVEILPFPTEELFKEAVLSLNLPDEEDYRHVQKSLDQETIASMARKVPMDGRMNHKYFMQQQTNHVNNRYMIRSNPLLNPFAWAEFIKSIKRGDFKKDD